MPAGGDLRLGGGHGIVRSVVEHPRAVHPECHLVVKVAGKRPRARVVLFDVELAARGERARIQRRLVAGVASGEHLQMGRNGRHRAVVRDVSIAGIRTSVPTQRYIFHKPLTRDSERGGRPLLQLKAAGEAREAGEVDGRALRCIDSPLAAHNALPVARRRVGAASGEGDGRRAEVRRVGMRDGLAVQVDRQLARIVHVLSRRHEHAVVADVVVGGRLVEAALQIRVRVVVLHARRRQAARAEVELAARHREALVSVVIHVARARAHVQTAHVHRAAGERRVAERAVVCDREDVRAAERAAVHDHLVPVRRSAAVLADARVVGERERRAGPNLHDRGLRRRTVDGKRKVVGGDVRAVAEHEVARVGPVGHADARLDRPVARRDRDRLVVGAVVELDVVRVGRRELRRNRRARRAGVDRDQTARDSRGVNVCGIGKSSRLAHAPPERAARHGERRGHGRPVRRRTNVRRTAGNRKVQCAGCGGGIDIHRACTHQDCSFTR